MAKVRGNQSEDETDLRRGPWTVEEDFILINYIAHHGEGRWNTLAPSAGLKRTGKSCRLRWLNYLRPDVRRGNITLEEQLLILQLHSRWGNRWSKIAQHLPGRTDNEIKNYWRTRVQKHAKQLKCDVNSKQFKDTMRYLWMPRLVERIQAAANANANGGGGASSPSTTDSIGQILEMEPQQHIMYSLSASESPESFGTAASDLTETYPTNRGYYPGNQMSNYGDDHQLDYLNQGLDYFDEQNSQWMDGGDTFWNADDMGFLQQQFTDNVYNTWNIE